MTTATSLERVTTRSVVFVDDQGNVRPPTRWQLTRWQLLSRGAWWAPSVGLGAMVLFGMGAWPLLLAGSVAGVVMNLRAYHWMDLWNARRFQFEGQLDHAERAARALLASSLAGRAHKIAAHVVLAQLAARRGQHQAVLDQLAAARRLHRGRLRVHWEFVELLEITALTNLDRLGEARTRLEPKLTRVPDGDFLRLSQWTTELYLYLCEGKHPLAHADLAPRATMALSVPAGGALIALCAWAHLQLSDLTRAHELVHEALNRSGELYLDTRMPRLHQWLQANAHLATPERGRI